MNSIKESGVARHSVPGNPNPWGKIAHESVHLASGCKQSHLSGRNP
jgi:hypothetical protein